MTEAPATPRKKGWSVGKIIGLVFVAIFATCVAPCAGIGFYVVSQKEKLAATNTRLEAEGTDFGATTTSDACVPEALKRGAAIDGWLAASMASVFARACFASAAPSEKTCYAVPKASDFATSTLWQATMCPQRGLLPNVSCGPVYQALQQFCADSDETR